MRLICLIKQRPGEERIWTFGSTSELGRMGGTRSSSAGEEPGAQKVGLAQGPGGASARAGMKRVPDSSRRPRLFLHQGLVCFDPEELEASGWTKSAHWEDVPAGRM